MVGPSRDPALARYLQILVVAKQVLPVGQSAFDVHEMPHIMPGIWQVSRGSAVGVGVWQETSPGISAT